MTYVANSTVMWPYYHSNNVSNTASSNDDGVLGKDDFMKILLTQLSSQDPLQPVQDQEFIAQMAQFSALEQMMNVADQLNQLRNSLGISSDLIGKQVEWQKINSAGEVEVETGVVESIRFVAGQQYVEIGDELISLDQITQVSMMQEEN